MKNKSFLLAALGLGGMARQYRQGIADLVKIQSAIYYLKMVRSVRRVCILFLEISLFANFFLMGLILLHGAAYVFLMYGPSRNVWVLLSLGLIETGITLGGVLWFLSSGRWVREAVKASPALKKAAEENIPKEKAEMHHLF